MTDNIDVTINNINLYVPNLIPSVETKVMFNEATQNNYKISYDEWFTERRSINRTQLLNLISEVLKMFIVQNIWSVLTKRKIGLMVPYQLKMLLYSIILILENIILR